jgi:phosphoglucomutase
MAAYARDKGISLFDMMLEMYVKYGFYKEKLISITKKGKSGAEEIQAMMKELRENPPKTIAGSPLLKIMDYASQKERDMKTGKESAMEFPKENVLQFLTEDGSLISARPSGTEPKIKFYCSVNAKLDKKENYDQVSADLDKKVDMIMKDMKL